MKLYAPKYYTAFKCIADKCSHSCCIGWEIDVDENTAALYRTLNNALGKEIIKSIDFSHTPHFILEKDERCPHLDSQGLCKIISNFGEEYLCDICREHPRFYNDTPRGKEVGLGMACEEACRIILNSNDYDLFIQVEDDGKDPEPADFDPTVERTHIYSILKDYSLSFEDRLKKVYNEHRVAPFMLNDTKWREIINELEYLDNSHKELFLLYSFETTSDKETSVYLERSLAYFIYRHCSESFNYEEFCANLGFCLFCERLLCSLVKTNPCLINEFARIVSEEIEYSEDNTEKITNEFYFSI